LDWNIHVIVGIFVAVAQIVINSLTKVDIDLRSLLFSEVVLTGGNTMMEGFPERFFREIRKLWQVESKWRIFAHPSRDTMCWEGGSIFAGLSSMKNQWITKSEYHEQREGILLRKSI
jgi:centractin